MYVLGITVQDMLLNCFFSAKWQDREWSGDVVLAFLMSFLKSVDTFPTVSVANFVHVFVGWVTL